MKRDQHTFQFTGMRIGYAAAAEAKYHDQRVEFWKSEQDMAQKAASSAAVTTREYPVTGGKRVELVVDTALAARLTECTNKIESHRLSAERYAIEAGAYASQPDRLFELHPDDVFYFRLAGGPRDD